MSHPAFVQGVRLEFTGKELIEHFAERARHHATLAAAARTEATPYYKRHHQLAEWYAVASVHIWETQTYLLSHDDLTSIEWFGLTPKEGDGDT